MNKKQEQTPRFLAFVLALFIFLKLMFEGINPNLAVRGFAPF